ncbi:hypothetical protein PAMC26577_30160 [Caballeronia sordidicola]|uniref:Uncharacterized protein n=1 Tax=Caballeronia sordidicola TaxID=196367 RepID=A0A242MEZ0_CABSO|nr:hypothetical protein PAMC26577_30160 [Caballeronia sordidicola]
MSVGGNKKTRGSRERLTARLTRAHPAFLYSSKHHRAM